MRVRGRRSREGPAESDTLPDSLRIKCGRIPNTEGPDRPTLEKFGRGNASLRQLVGIYDDHPRGVGCRDAAFKIAPDLLEDTVTSLDADYSAACVRASVPMVIRSLAGLGEPLVN
jgi:hypothetical protein